MRKIQFKIGKKGDVTVIDVCGAGQNCQALTQDVEKMLGTVDESSRAATDNAYVNVDPLKLNTDAN